MAFVVAALVLLTLLCLFNLLISLGLARRLRQHADLLSKQGAPDQSLRAGDVVGDFAATTTEGEPVGRGLLAGHTLVAFLSPGCAPCKELMPEFEEYAARLPRSQVLAVVDAIDDLGAREYTDRLSPVARVVVEDPDGPMQRAFKPEGFPALYVVEDGGLVVAADRDLRRIRTLPESVYGA
ncbi:TlpA family protein disulfide reductase [Bailinhaonella thermotolerans]|uniref:TlpA family protein disulfide reductase n=1 Tax=Bailinhaonella thermotolerans TaxID=1070861 RepID=A0A3A4B361_9ACTN|nr:TlpA disulfide reductase family protein [Bailinhaonella thermotolerans]RJL32605.1 TlpA family protein disulfide reductase [Bailinhaonella thermotolerans]